MKTLFLLLLAVGLYSCSNNNSVSPPVNGTVIFQRDTLNAVANFGGGTISIRDSTAYYTNTEFKSVQVQFQIKSSALDSLNLVYGNYISSGVNNRVTLTNPADTSITLNYNVNSPATFAFSVSINGYKRDADTVYLQMKNIKVTKTN